MYTTCIFCYKPLGANRIIENFPVGRRLAFDAAKGRLWVVCRSCERWNLTPLETRWEAVEECERAFRATKLRVSTENIGLARLSEGLDLVRVGAPQRPEFAAWRYGDQFGRRRTRAIMVGGGIAVAAGAVMLGSMAAGMSIGGFGGFWGNIPTILRATKVVRIRTADGKLLKMRGNAIATTVLRVRSDDSLHLQFSHKSRPYTFSGDEARRHAQRILPVINSGGGNKRTVQEAVQALETSKGPEAFVAMVAASTAEGRHKKARTVSELPAPTRLALEMALHEETERNAIEGELDILEAAWREAEEIAEIADNMFLPPEVDQRLEEMRKRSGSL